MGGPLLELEDGEIAEELSDDDDDDDDDERRGRNYLPAVTKESTQVSSFFVIL